VELARVQDEAWSGHSKGRFESTNVEGRSELTRAKGRSASTQTEG